MRSSRIVPIAATSMVALFCLTTTAAVLAPGPTSPNKPTEALVDAYSASTAPPASWAGDYGHNPMQTLIAAPVVTSPPVTGVPSLAHPTTHRPRSISRVGGGTPKTSHAAPIGIWGCIRAHESGGNYSNNDTGHSGHFGAYQFSMSTWRAMGGTGNPADAPPVVQDAMAQKLQRVAGWGQWSTAAGCGA